MIGKVLRGQRVHGLLYYLFGPGRNEEHTDPHIVAGWRHPSELEPPIRPDGHRDFRNLGGLLCQPHTALGPRGLDRPVWHCVLRAAPEDRILSDAEWSQIAQDVMDRTSLAPSGQEDEAIRWIAVRHAPDHIHIVGMLARQDGAQPRFWNDFFRVREACQSGEERYGLRRTAPGDRTAGHRPTRAENEKARRQGRPEPPRITLRWAVSTAVAGAASEAEFFTRLREAGVLVRIRTSVRDPGQVTGYAVALLDDTERAGGPVWFGGAKLAADLSLTRLRSRWPSTSSASPGIGPGDRFTPEERTAIWEHAARTAQQATEHIRATALTDPDAASDAAWAAADTLHTAAAALNSRELRQAADSYARAARAPYARIPHPSPAGDRLRRTARLLSAVTYSSQHHAQDPAALVLRLAELIIAVAELREIQQRTAQATAARTAARHLHAAAHRRRPAPAPAPTKTQPRTAAQLAALDFPTPLRLHQPAPHRPGYHEPATPQSTCRPNPHRPQGPTR